mmetsp:Transcript_12537/g.41346  ORF Transcript_12537/g.41346 Transcript_12537/m.41346 type:complete len:284 (+) Transcript_12537:798-1649(+)
MEIEVELERLLALLLREPFWVHGRFVPPQLAFIDEHHELACEARRVLAEVVLRLEMSLELIVVLEIRVLVRVCAPAEVASEVFSLHVREELPVAEEARRAEAARGVSVESGEPELVVGIRAAAAHVLLERRLRVEHLLVEEHLPPLETHVAQEELVLRLEVVLERVQARELHLAPVALALRARHGAQRRQLLVLIRIVAKHTQVLQRPNLPAREPLRQRLHIRWSCVRSERLGHQHRRAVLLAYATALVLEHEAEPHAASRTALSVPAVPHCHPLERLSANCT